MIDQQIYVLVLVVVAIANIVMGFSLLVGNSYYRDYGIYRRSRMLTAFTFIIFAAGFIAHSQLNWRQSWSIGATALSISYFHLAAVLFGWSHISLLNPNYLTRRVAIRDIVILVVGIIAYWTAAAITFPAAHFIFLIFFAHALYISYIFYRTLLRVPQQTMNLPVSRSNARWWTDINRLMVIRFQNSIRISCHLIVIFGLGSIVITVMFPVQHLPYIILTTMGMVVFSYIYYALTEYGSVIEAGTNATEDVAAEKDKDNNQS